MRENKVIQKLVPHKNKQKMFIMRHGERMDATIGYHNWFNMHFKQNSEVSRIFYDTPLTLNGKKHAYNTGKTIAEICQNPVCFIYSSPFTRCIETSIQVCNAIEQIQGSKCLIRVEYAIAECLGPWHDYQKYFDKDSIILDDVMDVLFIKKRYPGRIDTDYKPVIKRQSIHNFEAAEEGFVRNARFYKQVVKKHPNDQDIIIITHSSAFMSFVIQWQPYSNTFIYKLFKNKVILPKNTPYTDIEDFVEKRRKKHKIGGKKTGILAIAYRYRNKWTSALEKPVKIRY